jgi:hypothetical protein
VLFELIKHVPHGLPGAYEFLEIERLLAGLPFLLALFHCKGQRRLGEEQVVLLVTHSSVSASPSTVISAAVIAAFVRVVPAGAGLGHWRCEAFRRLDEVLFSPPCTGLDHNQHRLEKNV